MVARKYTEESRKEGPESEVARRKGHWTMKIFEKAIFDETRSGS